jgi:hypothetical protein
MEELKVNLQDNSLALKNGANKIEDEKVAVENIKKLVGETDECKKPSKKLSELALKISKSPDPFANSHLRETKDLLKFIGKTPFSTSLKTIEKDRKDPLRLKAYKNFFVSLFESVLIMKKIEPLSESDLEIRILSIPRPMNLRCNVIIVNRVANKTLVLDLDETLIHCEEEGQGEIQIPIKLPDGRLIDVFTLIFLRLTLTSDHI